MNTFAGGTFAANLHQGRFDLRDLPRLAFDYRSTRRRRSTST
jgi:hypothetical protein